MFGESLYLLHKLILIKVGERETNDFTAVRTMLVYKLFYSDTSITYFLN